MGGIYEVRQTKNRLIKFTFSSQKTYWTQTSVNVHVLATDYSAVNNIKTANKSFEVGLTFKYSEMTVRNKNYIHEVMSRLNSSNACWHSVQYFQLIVS
jgi:hypothetical protein